QQLGGNARKRALVVRAKLDGIAGDAAARAIPARDLGALVSAQRLAKLREPASERARRYSAFVGNGGGRRGQARLSPRAAENSIFSPSSSAAADRPPCPATVAARRRMRPRCAWRAARSDPDGRARRTHAARSGSCA